MGWLQKYSRKRIQTSSQAKLLLNFSQKSLIYFGYFLSELTYLSEVSRHSEHAEFKKLNTKKDNVGLEKKRTRSAFQSLCKFFKVASEKWLHLPWKQNKTNSIFALTGAAKGGILMALDERMGGRRMGLKCHCKGVVPLDQRALWLQRCRQSIAASSRHRLAPEGSKCLLGSLTF